MGKVGVVQRKWLGGLSGVGVASIGILLAASATVEAGFARDLVRGAQILGFQPQAPTGSNPLSGGGDITLTRNFVAGQVDSTFDFGDFLLQLDGPVNIQAGVGGRLDRTIFAGIQIGSQANPLSYTVNYDIAGTEAQLQGQTVFNGRVEIDQFGFYEIDLRGSNRETFDSAGRAGELNNIQTGWDVGPFALEGNLFADLLATITDPLFEATNTQNFFEVFSGRALREANLQAQADAVQDQIASGDVDAGSIEALLGAVSASRILGDELPDISFVDGDGIAVATRAQLAAVPEPATIAILLAGSLVALKRRR